MRINFTESTLTTLKRTANCSYANAVYKLTMKAQQGLKCDDIYKKSVLMHEVNKLLCKYKLDTCISFYDSEECTLYTEEQLNCITPDNLQVLYEFTHKYKETAAKSSKRATTPSSTTSSSTSDCCTWGSIGGSIGNQSDLVNYLATVEKNMISVKDEGTEITSDVKSINFVGSGVTAASVNGNVTVTIPGGGGGGSTYTVDNGLTESPANNFQLGGTLIQDTTIDHTDKNLTFTGAPTTKSDSLINIITSGGLGGALTIDSNRNAILINAATKGIEIASSTASIEATGTLPSSFAINNPSGSSSIDTVLVLGKVIGSPSSIGGGISLNFSAGDDTAGTSATTASIDNIYDDPNSASIDTRLVFKTAGSGSTTYNANMELLGNGQMKLNSYGVGNWEQSNIDYLLGVDNTGQTIEVQNIVKTFKKILSTAEARNAGVYQILPAPGAGYAIDIIEASIKLDYIAPSYATTRCFLSTGGPLPQFDAGYFITDTTSKFAKMVDYGTFDVAANGSIAPPSNLNENTALNVHIQPATISNGNGVVTIYGSYRIIAL